MCSLDTAHLDIKGVLVDGQNNEVRHDNLKYFKGSFCLQSIR